jgi:hypothetical protein
VRKAPAKFHGILNRQTFSVVEVKTKVPKRGDEE